MAKKKTLKGKPSQKYFIFAAIALAVLAMVFFVVREPTPEALTGEASRAASLRYCGTDYTLVDKKILVNEVDVRGQPVAKSKVDFYNRNHKEWYACKRRVYPPVNGCALNWEQNYANYLILNYNPHLDYSCSQWDWQALGLDAAPLPNRQDACSQGYKPVLPPWEHYVGDPGFLSDQDMREYVCVREGNNLHENSPCQVGFTPRYASIYLKGDVGRGVLASDIVCVK